MLSRGQIVCDGETERVLSDPELLAKHALESPLCYSRPDCQVKDAPLEMPLQTH